MKPPPLWASFVGAVSAHEGTVFHLERTVFATGDGIESLASQIASLYADEATAPPRWQEKEGLRKSLRQQGRAMVHAFGLGNLKEVSEQVEEFALKHFARA